MSHYRNLEVWQMCRVLTKEIYELSGRFPKREVYGLAAQMRSAAVSIMCNIAEGQGRWTSNDQIRFYTMARGSLLELETQMFIASDMKYFDATRLEAQLEKTEKIGKKLNNLINSTRNREHPEDGGPRTEDSSSRA